MGQKWVIRMKRMKSGRILPLVLGLCLLLGALAGCGGGSKNVAIDTVAAAVSNALGSSVSVTDADAGLIEGMMKLSASDYEDCVVKITVTGTSFDEYGIFKGKDATQAKNLESALQAYLKLKLDSDMGYQPQELPKLENAQVKSSGNYVMYCILDDAGRSAAISAFEEALK